MAVRMTFEITRRCNNACTYCSVDSTAKGPQMSVAQFRGYAQQVRELGVNMVGITGGDPLIHPQFNEIVRTAKDLGFESIEIAIGGWSSSFRHERVATLQNIFGEFGEEMQIGLVLSMSPLMFGGDQEAVTDGWNATIGGLLDLAPLMRKKVIETHFRDDGTSVSLRQLPWELIGVLTENAMRLPGGVYIARDEPIRLGDRLILDCELDYYEGVGRAKSLPGPKVKRNRRSCDYKAFKKDVDREFGLAFFDPYVTATGHLHPCCGVGNDLRPADEVAVKVDPEQLGSLRSALDWFSKNERVYFRRARRIMRRMKDNPDFCRACIEARAEAIGQAKRVGRLG